jgi:enolase-phosphatase E1
VGQSDRQVGLTFRLHDRDVQAVVLDIEGTTTPIAFVYDVLFPFARAHLRDYLRQHFDDENVREARRLLRAEWSGDVTCAEQPPPWPDDGTDLQVACVAAYVEWLMDRDRKSTGLKLLQGLIWEEGYRAGGLTADLFPDVPPALHRWRDAQLDVAMYSSGSQLAQRLLFGYTRYGDLTGLISRFFDTTVGAKISPDSYRRIADQLGCAAHRIVFVSDVVRELDAASAAGWQTVLSVRPGNAAQPEHSFPVIQSFDQIV